MNTQSPHTPKASPPAAMRRRWPALFGLFGLSALGLLAGAWWWSGSNGSLATGLRWANAVLPAGQQLHSQAVQGSLRHGGRIGRLSWQSTGQSITLEELQFDLNLALLLRGRMPLQQLHIARLEGEDRRTDTPPGLWTPGHWPLQMDVGWRIDTLQWQAATAIQAQDLGGRYVFDGQHHRLRLDSLDWAQGRYQGQLELQAQGPQALTLQLQGQLTQNTPSSKPIDLQADVQLRGTLAGAQARLALQASVQAPKGHGPRLDVQGELQPQASPAVVALQARMQGLDLAMLWPQAPHTAIDGELHLAPQAQGWQLRTTLSNRLSGPLDRQRLPVQQLQATLHHDGQNWQLQQALARWPGGQMQGHGHWEDGTWRGALQVHALQAGQWWSSLQSPALSGPITLGQDKQGTLDVQAQLQSDAPAPSPSAARGRGDRLSLQARRQDQRWTLQQLDLQWLELQLQAQGRWSAEQQALEGQARFQAPGLQGQLEGQVSQQQGQGQWQLDVQDMARLRAWLARWPTAPQNLPAWPATHTLLAMGQWQGGWRGEGVALQARVQQGHTQLQASVRLQPQETAGHWQGQVTQLQYTGMGQATRAADALRLQLAGPLVWVWEGAARRLRWDSHRWQLGEPQRPATLEVQAGQWQAAPIPGAQPVAHVQARLQALPLAWTRALGWPEMSGDLMLQGGLDLAWGEHPRLLAWLERASGDLQMATDVPQQTRGQAGVRSARLQLRVDGAQASSELHWDSAQAGQLEARLDSRLNLDSATGLDGLWGAQAPLTGQIQARLPRVGVWAWLAPPGWRVQGSLDARVQVSGTRAQPEWQGQLQADNLAVRSAVEGVEFGQGRLRARLQAQQMLLDEFELQGAGAQGGRISAQGQVRWNPQGKTLTQAVEMALQMQASKLRVTNRADRRLSVSGQVQAQLRQGQMQLRGTLEADTAQFILSDDNTPTLGKDVVILQASAKAATVQTPAGLSVMGVPDVHVLLRLGPDFRLSGQGIDTRLAGELQLTSNAASAALPQLTGQVRTEGGRYRAYGQQLDIEQGLLHFTGPYDNPALDILALRPNLGQRVGVRVSGTALAPRVRLYADPDMPDADKLAWLVLGRSPAAGGAESAVLQQAALALLGGSGKRLGGELALALGVDDISLANRSTTTATGSTATGTAVLLGKRLSRDFYLAYESSVSGAFGNLFIFYDLSRKLTLRAQAGEFNALDLVYTIRHD